MQNFWMLRLRRSRLCRLSLLCLASLSSGCVTLRDTTQCAADGLVSVGGICTHSLSSKTAVLSPAEFIDFLESQPKRHCVPVPDFNICSDDQAGVAVDLPARGAAIGMSSDDWGTMKTELDEACRELGPKCTLSVKALIQHLNKMGL